MNIRVKSPTRETTMDESTDGSGRNRELRRYEAILESLDDAVYAVRSDGTIAYVNDRYAEMKGVSRSELIGTDLYDWVTEETAERGTRVRREIADGDLTAGGVEYEFLTADGDRFPVEMRFTVVDDERADGVAGLDCVGVIRDIDARKRREDALKRKNERLEEFADIVSHDLRNPLNVAAGRLVLAREECDSEHLDAIADAHDRMGLLIDDLLTLAREGESDGAASRVSLRELVDDCWVGVETASAALSVETDRAVYAQRSRLRQMFENLIRNAVEHGDEAVTITVSDLGGGFYVADDGTGFGLDIVQTVASDYGWDVRVTEAATGGARFEFTGLEVVD